MDLDQFLNRFQPMPGAQVRLKTLWKMFRAGQSDRRAMKRNEFIARLEEAGYAIEDDLGIACVHGISPRA